MNKIKYIVVCKNGYLFTSSKEEIIKFVEFHGKNISYYFGYYNPIENLDFLSDIKTNVDELGTVYYD